MTLRRLEHLLVLTDDLEGTRAFYCDVLGFESGARPPFPFSGLWLYLDGEPCLHVADRAEYELELTRRGLGSSGSPFDHAAFQGEDFEALSERIAAAGVDVVHNVVPGVLRQLYLTDPNGIRIELNVPDDSHRDASSG